MSQNETFDWKRWETIRIPSNSRQIGASAANVVAFQHGIPDKNRGECWHVFTINSRLTGVACRCSYHPLCLGEATKAAERTLRQARGSGGGWRLRRCWCQGLPKMRFVEFGWCGCGENSDEDWWSHGRCPPTLRCVPTVLGWCGVKEQSQKLSRAVSSGRLDEAVYIRNIGKESSLCSEDAWHSLRAMSSATWRQYCPVGEKPDRRPLPHWRGGGCKAWEVSRALVVSWGSRDTVFHEVFHEVFWAGICVVSWKVCWRRLLTHFIWHNLKIWSRSQFSAFEKPQFWAPQWGIWHLPEAFRMLGPIRQDSNLARDMHDWPLAPRVTEGVWECRDTPKGVLF